MPEMDGSSKPPQQITEMFHKFALAFKTKTFEFFADDESAAAAPDGDGFFTLDSAEEIITDQKVVVIKPDHTQNPPQQQQQQQQKQPQQKPQKTLSNSHTQMAQNLISSLYATISSFEASYLQFQTAHVPFIEENVKAADRNAVLHLRKLSDLKRFYSDFVSDSSFDVDFSLGSCLEAQVEENQSKLRALETVSNRLQAEIDAKDNEVSVMRQELDKVLKINANLSKRLCKDSSACCAEVLLSVRVFDSVLHDACRSVHRFTKLLIDLMRKAKWDLELAANSVYLDVDYVKKGHSRYAFLSYVCLGIFRGFDLEGFGLVGSEVVCNGKGLNLEKICSLKQLVDHVSANPMEVLRGNPNCEFSRFCEKKYEELVHPTMESSIFSSLDQNEVVVNSWRSLSMFYESFVSMASSIWILHKLAFSFDPVVEIFQVERGVDFSMVYMEDVTRKCVMRDRTRAKVGFTVVPGFKVGRTVIQSQVYLTGLKCTE